MDTPTNTPTAVATFTPTITNTPNSSDLIFADGFESGNLLAWTCQYQRYQCEPRGRTRGHPGLQALINDNNAIFVNTDSPNAEPRYRARFYFDPNSILMANNDAHIIFKGFAGASTEVLKVEFHKSAGYEIRVSIADDASTFINSNFFTISDAPHVIEIDWRAATAPGANNGGLTLWIDNVQQVDLTGVDNDTRRVDSAKLGALSGIDTGTRGTYFFDAFESRRQTFIGP